jgi:hypothetical protein
MRVADDSRRYVRFIGAVVALVVVTLGSVASFNFVVDPFQQYRLARDDKRRFVHSLQRYISPGLARNSDYELVIQGSSMMENFNIADVAERCGMKAVNLALSAVVGFEQRMILEVAFRERPVRKVILSLDFNSFTPGPDQSSPDIPEPLPMHLYDRNLLNDIRYLANWSVATRSYATLNKVQNERYTTDPNEPWAWYRGAVSSKQQTTSGLDPQNINKNFRQPQRTLTGMKANFDKNIAELIERHPNTQFDIFFPPYSILVWADFVQRNQLDVSLDFKRYTFERLGKLKNVRIFDMQWDQEITHNLDLYKDIYHHNPEQNNKMVAASCANQQRHLVTAGTANQFIDSLRRQALAARPEAWIETPHKP